MAAPRQLRRLLRGAAGLAAARPITTVFAVALAVWWIQALVIPLTGGRDLATYLGAYVQLSWSDPVDLGYVLGRTPLAPLVIGFLLDVAHGALAELVVSLLYAGSIVAWFVAARRFSARAAVLTAIVLLAYPGYGILFHELSSDALFAAAFAGWALLLVDAVRTPAWRRFAAAGAGVGVLVLIRPSNQVLLALAVLPLVLRLPLRVRLTSVVAFLVPALVLVGGWVLHNGIRYGDYVVVRGGNATVPFYRAFVTDRIVRPSNGPQTRELARVVQRRLLPEEPYRSYGITLDRFFRESSPRMVVDLIALSDRLKGWYTNDRWLRQVGIEAVRTHKATYARGVIGSTWGMLVDGLYRSPPPVPASAAGATATAPPTVVVKSRPLPQPTEGEPIPAPHEGGITTPDGSIYTVWTSPTEHHMVFKRPRDAARNAALHRRMGALAANLPDRRGSPSLAVRFNQASRWFPWPALWLGLGLAALAFRRPRAASAIVAPSLAGLAVIVISAMGLPAEPHYSVPVAPAFVLLAGAAVFAPRGATSRVRVAELGRTAARVAGLAAAVLAGAWAVIHYVDELRDFVASSYAPHDLAVFLGAASKVLHGVSPYAFNADQTYAYPPLLAFLVSPLQPLGPGIAALVWTLVSLAAVIGALWLLEVRDWRCFALTGAFLFTRSAVDLGTIGPLLLLALAVAWHWRGRLVEPAIAIGAAIALKLFLWPLVVWPLVMRRLRASVASVGFALVLVLVPWAVIGFDGLTGYARLLRRLSGEEATSSYSVIALAVRAHLPEAAGVALSVIAAVTLLAAAAWIARDRQRARRDRDVAVLTLVLAAALAASPIVWVHYFLLLLVPLALTRPRLSLLWFVPFAYSWVGEAGWPAGNGTWLGIVLAATVIILGGSLLEVLARGWRLRLPIRGHLLPPPGPRPTSQKPSQAR